MEKKKRRKAPQWILSLPPGVYDTDQLLKITGLSRKSMQQTIVKYGAKVKKVIFYKNLIKHSYIWDGYRLEDAEDG